MAYTKAEVIPAEEATAESAKGTAADIKSPLSTLGKDEAELLRAYRKAKKLGYADIAVTIQEGKRVKLWLTEKIK